MTDQHHREILDTLFFPVRLWLCAAMMAIDYYLEIRRYQRGEGRHMTRDEHEERFGDGTIN